MVKVEFEYKDSMSNWEWRKQSCTVSTVAEFIRIYGLDMGDVEYRIISVTEV